MRRSFKYRLWTTPNQERELSIVLETHRRLYNSMLAQRMAAWECDRVNVNFVYQSRYFTSDRKNNSYYFRLNRDSVTATLRRLDKAYQSFFRRVKSGAAKAGFPIFKGQGRFSSIEFPAYGSGIKLNHNKLYVQHVGDIRVRLHRPHQGKIKVVTLRFETGKWYVILCCDLGEIATIKSTGPAIGIDLGLEHFLTTSDGEHIENPRFHKYKLPALRVAGRSVSRKKRGGANRRKAVVQLASIHRKISNSRRDHHHKTALNLTRRFGTVVLESLTVANMVRNRKLSRSIADAGWSAFAAILQHHGQKAGAGVIVVNPSFTSQMCSECGVMVQKTLSERQHVCACGCSLQRDHNAARNILARGLARAGPAGLNTGDSLYVQRSNGVIAHA